MPPMIYWNAYGMFKHRRLKKRPLWYRVRNWLISRFSKNRAYSMYTRWN